MTGKNDGSIDAIRKAVVESFEIIAGHPEYDPKRACVILSGGVDSSIVAQVGTDILGLTDAFTILASQEATDREHAAQVAPQARLRHHVLDMSLEEALRELPHCVRVLKTFDPMQLRNSIAISAALRAASTAGFKWAITGDAADELLGGYNFTHGLEAQEWLDQRAHMVSFMHFSSVPLGASHGVRVASPYTQPRFIAAALACDKSSCVGEHMGTRFGKLPLREAFPEVLTAWRRKDPIEVGCGTTALGDRPWLPGSPSGYLSTRMSDEEFVGGVKEAAAQGVRIRDKEHLRYWQEFCGAFQDIANIPGLPRWGKDPCPACGYELNHPTQTFCVTCGHYDPALRDRKGR